MNDIVAHQQPILVAYHNRFGVEWYPTDVIKPVGVFEGDTRTSVGKRLSIVEALSYRWAEHLNKAGAQWFIPILQDLAQGEPKDDQLVERVKHEAFKRIKRTKV